MRDTKVRVCAVCARVLDWKAPGKARGFAAAEVGDDAAEGWFHLVNPDGHIPVPVEPDEVAVNGQCDLCSASNPRWEVPARDFLMPHLPGHGSRGHWSACDTCALAVEKGDWDRILDRAMDTYRRQSGRRPNAAVRTVTSDMHRVLRENILGPVRPLVWPPTRTPGQDR